MVCCSSLCVLILSENATVYVISFAQPAVIKMGLVGATVCVVLTAPQIETVTNRVLSVNKENRVSHSSKYKMKIELSKHAITQCALDEEPLPVGANLIYLTMLQKI